MQLKMELESQKRQEREYDKLKRRLSIQDRSKPFYRDQKDYYLETDHQALVAGELDLTQASIKS